MAPKVECFQLLLQIFENFQTLPALSHRNHMKGRQNKATFCGQGPGGYHKIIW